MQSRKTPLWIFPLAATLLVLLWQWATVTANFGGNWSGLFCTGELQRHPPILEQEHIYLFAGSTGYDGQFYHYIAHDPALRTNIAGYVDAPQLRDRRILVPALAYALAFGRTAWIDLAYRTVILLAIAFGVYCACRFCVEFGLPPAWGMLFLLLPAIPISMDRMVVDGLVAAFTAAFLLLCWRPSWQLFLLLCAAALTRETGFLLAAGYCAWLIWQKQIRTAAVFALSAAPALAWYVYVHSHTVPDSHQVRIAPLWAIADAFRHPLGYPPGTPFASWVTAGDTLALCGLCLAILIAIARAIRRPLDAAVIVALLFAAMGLAVADPDPFRNVFDFGRVFTPLLLCLAAGAIQKRQASLLAPVALMLPRIAMQFVPQVEGIGRWLLSK